MLKSTLQQYKNISYCKYNELYSKTPPHAHPRSAVTARHPYQACTGKTMAELPFGSGFGAYSVVRCIRYLRPLSLEILPEQVPCSIAHAGEYRQAVLDAQHGASGDEKPVYSTAPAGPEVSSVHVAVGEGAVDRTVEREIAPYRHPGSDAGTKVPGSHPGRPSVSGTPPPSRPGIPSVSGTPPLLSLPFRHPIPAHYPSLPVPPPNPCALPPLPVLPPDPCLLPNSATAALPHNSGIPPRRPTPFRCSIPAHSHCLLPHTQNSRLPGPIL